MDRDMRDETKFLEQMKQRVEDIKSGKISETECLDFRVGAGVCNKDGSLKYPYNGEEPRGRDFAMSGYGGNLLKLTR